MKLISILVPLAVLVATQATPQATERSLVPTVFVLGGPSYNCKKDKDCPETYNCNCDPFWKLCVNCKECQLDEECRNKYNTPDSGCQCAQRLCVNCVEQKKEENRMLSSSLS